MAAATQRRRAGGNGHGTADGGGWHGVDAPKVAGPPMTARDVAAATGGRAMQEAPNAAGLAQNNLRRLVAVEESLRRIDGALAAQPMDTGGPEDQAKGSPGILAHLHATDETLGRVEVLADRIRAKVGC